MTAKQSTKKAHARSVSYPSIALPTAIERAKQFWDAAGKHNVPVVFAITCWGYSLKSSGGKLTLAALLNFGLLEDSGSNDKRHVKLTERAIRIILAPDATSRIQTIKEAAVMPKIYTDLLSKWEADKLPSDQTITYYLINEKNFNRNTVSTFIKNFRETIAFANLSSSDTIPPSDEQIIEKDDGLGGDNMVNSINIDPIITPPPPLIGMKQDTFSLDEGQVILKWPSKMKAESFEDFKAWLELQLRKIARSIE